MVMTKLKHINDCVKVSTVPLIDFNIFHCGSIVLLLEGIATEDFIPDIFLFRVLIIDHRQYVMDCGCISLSSGCVNVYVFVCTGVHIYAFEPKCTIAHIIATLLPYESIMETLQYNSQLHSDIQMLRTKTIH